LLSNGVAGKVLGGWQLSWNATLQSGTPVALNGNYYMYGDPQVAKGDQTIDHWFNTSSSIWVARPSDTLRTTQLRSSNIRSFMKPQLNGALQRVFRIHERQHVNVRLSAFNVTNTPILGAVITDPSSALFGKVTKSMNNLPRQAELSLKYQF
jgi:carotenoid cleavage dioxygenase-like enzyme